MKLMKTLLSSAMLFVVSFAQAQNPWAKYSYTPPKTLTLSDGKYQEFFTNDTSVQIGSVMFNTVTNEVFAFVENNDNQSNETNLKPEIVSRFLSIDPLTKEYPELTPYQYASNTPIQAIDIDGLERFDVYLRTNYGTDMAVVVLKELDVKLQVNFYDEKGTPISGSQNLSNFKYKEIQKETNKIQYSSNPPTATFPNGEVRRSGGTAPGQPKILENASINVQGPFRPLEKKTIIEKQGRTLTYNVGTFNISSLAPSLIKNIEATAGNVENYNRFDVYVPEDLQTKFIEQAKSAGISETMINFVGQKFENSEAEITPVKFREETNTEVVD